MYRNPWGKKSYFHPVVMRHWFYITSLLAFSLLLLLPHLLNNNCFGLVFTLTPKFSYFYPLPFSHCEGSGGRKAGEQLCDA